MKYRVKFQTELRGAEKEDVKSFMWQLAAGLHVQVGTEIFAGVKRLNVRQLEKGMVVFAGYAQYNAGVDVVEVLGFTATDPAYGKGSIVSFDSVADVMADEGVKSVKALEAKQNENEYGHHTYMVVRDLDHRDSRYSDRGPWYYLCDGRWSRGSGAEALSFVLAEKVGNVCGTCDSVLPDGNEPCEVCGTER